MIQKRISTSYTSDKAEGFDFTFEPLEDTIKVIKTESGYTIKYITRDNDPIDPRGNDHLGTMAFFHNRYDLGDKDHGIKCDDYKSWTEMEKALIQNHDAYMVIPVYMYDHSGITISAGGFSHIDSARWDWGQIGFIFISREKVLKEYNKLGKKTRDTVRGVLLAEIEEYDLYLTGEGYGVIAEMYNDDKVQIDDESVWGYLGIESAKECFEEV